MTNYIPASDIHLTTRVPPTPSRLYNIIWQFAYKRQQVYLRRVSGIPYPWTKDPIISYYKFTNVYRAADRVSQFLIRVIYSDTNLNPDTLFLRVMLFKIFNKIDTWETIVGQMGLPTAERFCYSKCANILNQIRSEGRSIYSAAYIMPSGGRQNQIKHLMHLELIRKMVNDNVPDRLTRSRSMSEAYELLRSYPTVGPFLAYQYSIDLNYSTIMDYSENEFVVPGPGALDGLSKCFESLGDYSPSDTIQWLTDIQDEEFLRLGLCFPDLWGRSLQLVDVQNILCEVSKYTRISHPEISGRSRRTRIKQKFKSTGPLQTPFFPPKWMINYPRSQSLQDCSLFADKVSKPNIDSGESVS